MLSWILYSRAARFIFLTIVIFSAILAAAIALLPFLVSTDAIRLRLARDLSTWTGHNVQLHGVPHISIFPSLQASLPGVTLTNATDNSAPLMQAEQIEVDLSFYDALRGRVRFSETRIIHPQFITDEPIKTVAGFFSSLSRSEGTLGVAIREAQQLVQQNPEKPDASQLLAQPFGRILIENGSLSYPAEAPGETEKITDINATIDWPHSTSAAALKASGQWHGALTSLTINANQALLLMGGGTSPLRISVNSNRGGITFTGTARFAQNILLNGQVAARSPGMDTTIAWLDGTGRYNSGITAPVVWESTLAAQSGHIELNTVTFTLGQDSARGALEITMQDGKPVTSGSLAFETLDLNQIIPAFPPGYSTPTDLSFLDRFGLDLRLSTTQATLGEKIGIRNLAASIQMRQDGLMLDIGNAQLFGGMAQSNIQLRRGKEAGPYLEGRLSASNISLDRLQAAFNRKALVHGDAGFSITLQSSFRQWADLLAHAQGNAAFNLNAGRLTGFDMDGFLKQVNTARPFSLTLADNADFAFDKALGRATFDNGQITLETAQVSFGEHNLDLKGKFNLPGNKLHLTGMVDRPQLTGGMCADIRCLARSLQPVKRFMLAGPWEKPVISPVATE